MRILDPILICYFSSCMLYHQITFDYQRFKLARNTLTLSTFPPRLNKNEKDCQQLCDSSCFVYRKKRNRCYISRERCCGCAITAINRWYNKRHLMQSERVNAPALTLSRCNRERKEKGRTQLRRGTKRVHGCWKRN